MTHQTNFAEIKFNEANYTYRGQQLTSVTKYLSRFQTPFDRDGTAERMANKPGETRTAQEFIDEWARLGEQSRELGMQVHHYIETVLTGKAKPPDDPFLSLNDRPPETKSFDTIWARLEPLNHVKHVEWIVGDAGLGVAGTVDCVLYSRESGKYHICDWKTGKLTVSNRWQNLLHPFTHLDASKSNTYSLQLSLYRLIIERNTALDLGDSYLIHLRPDGYEIYQALDLREPLLTHFNGHAQSG